MAEYIEREALIESLHNHYEVRNPNQNAIMDEVCMMVFNTAAADVVPARHGKWVNKGDYAVCTECGERSGMQYDGVEPIPLMTKFCSNCGSKMDGRID